MRKKLLIFGTGPSADVAFQIFQEFTNYIIEGFILDEKFIEKRKHLNKPVYPYEEIKKSASFKEIEIFVSIGYSNLNTTRRLKCEQVCEDGFVLASMVHPEAKLPANFKHGNNCFIMNDVHIHPYVEIGNNNFIWSGVTLCHHVTVGSHCWFTSGSLVAGNSIVGSHCFLGASSTITNNIKIGNHCFVGAGSLVTKNMANQTVIIREGDKPYRLNSEQFLKLINNKY